MAIFKQFRSLTLMSVQSLPLRVGSSMVVVIGTAGVVAVLLAVLATASGLGKAMRDAGRADRAIILRTGASSELASVLPRQTVAVIANVAAGLRRDDKGEALLAPEVMSLVTGVAKNSDNEVSVTLRGVGKQLALVRPEVKLVRGRMFTPGLPEVIAGKAASSQFDGLQIGDRLSEYGRTWTIVGIFASNGDPRESELLTDADTLLSANGGNAYQSIVAVLSSAAAFEQFQASLAANPQLGVDVHRERDYLRDQSQYINRMLYFIAYVVGGIMAVGAIFAALNSMYSAVSTRTREIATLRAIGFGAVAVIGAVIAEAVLLALLGSALGALIAWIAFNGHEVSTAVGGALPNQLVFDLALDWQAVALACGVAALIGIAGGSLPALHAARVNVAQALRAL